MNWPNPLSNSTPFGAWMNSLLKKCVSSELKSVIGGKLTETTLGKTLVIDRQVGGGDKWPPTIYDDATAYSTGQWVWVQSTNAIVTTGDTYPPTGLTAYSKAGLWRCVRSASAGIFPVAPYPSPDDPTGADQYWLYFGNLYC